jgi:hypothetical protein
MTISEISARVEEVLGEQEFRIDKFFHEANNDDMFRIYVWQNTVRFAFEVSTTASEQEISSTLTSIGELVA